MPHQVHSSCVKEVSPCTNQVGTVQCCENIRGPIPRSPCGHFYTASIFKICRFRNPCRPACLRSGLAGYSAVNPKMRGIGTRLSTSTVHGIDSVNDLRSWSACQDDRRRYFLEHMGLTTYNDEYGSEQADHHLIQPYDNLKDPPAYFSGTHGTSQSNFVGESSNLVSPANQSTRGEFNQPLSSTHNQPRIPINDIADRNHPKDLQSTNGRESQSSTTGKGNLLDAEKRLFESKAVHPDDRHGRTEKELYGIPRQSTNSETRRPEDKSDGKSVQSPAKSSHPDDSHDRTEKEVYGIPRQSTNSETRRPEDKSDGKSVQSPTEGSHPDERLSQSDVNVVGDIQSSHSLSNTDYSQSPSNHDSPLPTVNPATSVYSHSNQSLPNNVEDCGIEPDFSFETETVCDFQVDGSGKINLICIQGKIIPNEEQGDLGNCIRNNSPINVCGVPPCCNTQNEEVATGCNEAPSVLMDCIAGGDEVDPSCTTINWEMLEKLKVAQMAEADCKAEFEVLKTEIDMLKKALEQEKQTQLLLLEQMNILKQELENERQKNAESLRCNPDVTLVGDGREKDDGESGGETNGIRTQPDEVEPFDPSFQGGCNCSPCMCQYDEDLGEGQNEESLESLAQSGCNCNPCMCQYDEDLGEGQNEESLESLAQSGCNCNPCMCQYDEDLGGGQNEESLESLAQSGCNCNPCMCQYDEEEDSADFINSSPYNQGPYYTAAVQNRLENAQDPFGSSVSGDTFIQQGENDFPFQSSPISSIVLPLTEAANGQPDIQYPPVSLVNGEYVEPTPRLPSSTDNNVQSKVPRRRVICKYTGEVFGGESNTSEGQDSEKAQIDVPRRVCRRRADPLANESTPQQENNIVQAPPNLPPSSNDQPSDLEDFMK